jgi:hypothetical protein
MYKEKRNTYRVLVKEPEEILGNVGVDEKLPNSTLKKCDGLMWLRLRTSGELLCKRS